jgi:glycogen debranching enzyme
MAERLLRILDGNTFVISNRCGDIETSELEPSGLFSFDTRFLSTWRLSLNGGRLSPLAADEARYFEARYFLVPGPPTHYVNASTSVVRWRAVNRRGFEEELTVINHGHDSVDYTVRLDIAADFADLLEIRGQDSLAKKGESSARVEDRQLVLDYRRGRFQRKTLVSPAGPADLDTEGLTFRFRLEPNSSWTNRVRVDAVVGVDDRDVREDVGALRTSDRSQLERSLADWRERAPRLATDWPPLAEAYHRSITDLAALRYSPLAFPDDPIPAAGLPWFMSIFGRDTIVSSLQALPYVPELAAASLRILAFYQGTRTDDWRDEEPGKIMMELRYGETAAFEDRPHSPYFGTADSTLLFLILLDEYERWSGDADLVRDLEPEARAAIGWIDNHAHLKGDGYVWYRTNNPPHGLQNQGWKTSPEAICFRDGRLGTLPRATCELQGYAYDAKLRTARLARLVWNDPGFAERLERQAAELKERFNRDFWIDQLGYYALALDGEGNQVDALASNMGHLLWSGIIDQSRAAAVVEHLLGPRLFSGWGVRCLAEGQARYNPVGYHVGTVWPFDNAFIAWGMRRYGFKTEAARIAQAVLEAAQYFQGRLPESFGGYDRDLTKYPVEYPTACSPHAWSTGTPLLLLRTLLGLEPFAEHLLIDPAVPKDIGRVELSGIAGRWGRTDAFARGRIEIGQGVVPLSEQPLSRRSVR